jgi:A/G-specific adenine glycosylase
MDSHRSGAPLRDPSDAPAATRPPDRTFDRIDPMPTHSGMSPSPTRLAALAIRWYAGAARDLPWRRPETSPWGVLVSEVMLQQTPVARVTPVYEEWLRRWPTPGQLAVEPAGAAIRAWARLGYPRRALRLHQCATAISDRHHGIVPADIASLRGLPGVGAYTARAVATFAFGQRHPVVDTNVRRLVARASTGLPAAGGSTTAADLLLVESLLPRSAERAARASIAFMELGALVCTAREPACDRCPLRAACAWHLAGRPPQAGHGRRRTQGYAGTDRQARGALLAVCRAAPEGVPRSVLDAAWPPPAQRARALAGLIEDGLIEMINGDRYGLPGILSGD